MDRITAILEATLYERDFGDRMEEYPCPFCGWWHIGHARKDEKQ